MAIIVFFICFINAIFIFYYIKIIKANKYYIKIFNSKNEVSIRKFPYPYKAAIAIANDIDSTNTVEEFINIHEFLNTKKMTNMGEGVGLEIADSFFMFNPKNHFSYFSNREIDKFIIRKFIEAGYIDSIHSWGDGYSDRNDAIKSISELKKHGLNLKIWINHSKEKSNFGGWYSAYLGDCVESKYYHSDITLSYGIKFVWLGSSTCIIGQSVPINIMNFIGSFDFEYPLKSTRNIVKNIGKNIISLFRLWETRYSLHWKNDLVKVVELKDGQKVYEFTRYDNHPDGIGFGADSKNMAYNLSERVIKQLKDVRGYGILYTHFGKNLDCKHEICEETQKALRNLEKEYRTGEVYVTTTSKLLTYYIIQKNLKTIYSINQGVVIIEILCVEDPIFGKFIPNLEELQGITFYVPSDKNVRILIDGKEIQDLIKNKMDENNRESVTIPIQHLTYPDLMKI